MASRRRTSSTLSRVALAAMLLAVQVTVAGHLDLDGHSQETQCAICVSVSTLDAASASEHELLVPVVAASTHYHELEIPIAAHTSGHQHARAPPSAS